MGQAAARSVVLRKAAKHMNHRSGNPFSPPAPPAGEGRPATGRPKGGVRDGLVTCGVDCRERPTSGFVLPLIRRAEGVRLQLMIACGGELRGPGSPAQINIAAPAAPMRTNEIWSRKVRLPWMLWGATGFLPSAMHGGTPGRRLSLSSSDPTSSGARLPGLR